MLAAACRMGRRPAADPELPSRSLLRGRVAYAPGSDDYLRWCVYCGADCFVPPGRQSHRDSCPTVTGAYPVEGDDVLMGLRCMDCGRAFGMGDYYVERELLDECLTSGVAMSAVVCLTCAAAAS